MAQTSKSKSKATPAKKPPVKTTTSTTKKIAKNASILTFFKKEDRQDELMFLDNSQTAIDLEAEHAELYDSSPEPRFNESSGSVKRRKLEINGDAVETDDQEDNKENEKELFIDEQRQNIMSGTGGVPVAKKRNKGPFVDDSDESGEEDAPEADDSPRQESTLVGGLAKATGSASIAIRESTTSSTGPPDAPPTAASASISRSADDIPIFNHQESTVGDFDEFEGYDLDLFDDGDDFEGEEFRERRFMEQQARLEAGEEASYSCDDGNVQGDDTMTACCPICTSSLAGITPDEATRHVNACLDGDPIPLPVAVDVKTPKNKAQKTPQQVYDEVEAPVVSRRFARAAVPRPGQANPFSLGGESTTTASGSASKPGSNSAFTKLMSGHAEDAAWASAAAAEHASRGKPAYQRTCPFYKIMPGFSISVDAFRYGAVEGCKAYFLSHFHSDHYIGLTANWSHGPIYCSAVTGSLVRSQLKTAAKWVVDLDWEVPVEVPGTGGVQVTMIPANHCPGSSLFLFEKSVGGANMAKKRKHRILHCGDFRACPAQVTHPLLKPDIIDAVTGKTRQQTIDVCYLDTTYLSPRYSFPPQDSVITACAELCATLNSSLKSGDEGPWQSVLRRRSGGLADQNDTSVDSFLIKPKSTSPAPAPRSTLSALGKPKPRLLVVCGTYSIGKERICKAIAQALNTKIFASPAKRKIVAQLGDPELTALLTSDPAAAQVHMQMLMEIRADTLATYLDSYAPNFSRVVGFRPSGWNYSRAGGNVNANIAPSSVATPNFLHGSGWRSRFAERDLVPQRGSVADAMCFGVPYSEHSSFRELGMFLMALRIEKVVPTVNVGSAPSRKRMKGWIDRWLSERRKGGVVKVLEEGEEGGLWGKEEKGNGVIW